jgi:hypothetical protein
LNNTGLGGHNIKEIHDPSLNVTRCCEECLALPGCVGWTLNTQDKACFLKDETTAGPSPTPGPQSGYNPHPLPPKPTPLTPTPKHPTPMPEPHPPISPTPKPSPAPAGAKNVLFVIADDMRPQLGCYGHDYMHTPEIDKLAASGTLFNRAYVQYSFCAPSRNR